VSERLEVDLCVIGAGSGGLRVAAGAALLGARTVLVERDRMGGECLNTGCVPSKALLAAAKHAASARAAAAFGIAAVPTIDFAAAMRRVQGVIAELAPQDSAERFAGLGVRVIRAEARFAAPDEVTAGAVAIRARRIIIATGSKPVIPPIPGLNTVPFFTNETIFENTGLPAHLVVIGGGSVGLELAQAHRLLGARVTVLEAGRALAKDDPELAALLIARLGVDGVEIVEGARVLRVERAGTGVAVVFDGAAGERRLDASHLLVAAGRRAALQSLALDQAGIATDSGGALVLDRRLRTTNRRVYAVGDAAGGPQFTHAAAYQAGIVIRNALFRLPARANYRALPRVTYTAPELARVGMTETEARQRFGRDIAILRAPFSDNDRAHAERATAGLVKVVTRRNGHILGASILGAAAGELIALWALAIEGRVRLKTVARMIVPYPTLGEASQRAAASYYAPKLFGERTRRLVRFLARFG
jgi:pyruvate/2-oxoglutarate dehydrogenase complex dihydrolipoamide dehydrogenase (E3) component